MIVCPDGLKTKAREWLVECISSSISENSILKSKAFFSMCNCPESSLETLRKPLIILFHIICLLQTSFQYTLLPRVLFTDPNSLQNLDICLKRCQWCFQFMTDHSHKSSFRSSSFFCSVISLRIPLRLRGLPSLS